MAGEDKRSLRHFFAKKMANEAALVAAQPAGRRRKSSLLCAVRLYFTSSRGVSRSSLKTKGFLPCPGVMK